MRTLFVNCRPKSECSSGRKLDGRRLSVHICARLKLLSCHFFDIGRKQADLTGQRLKQLGIPYMRLVHSTMTRAIETAELIHEHIKHVPMESCELIREGEPVPPEPPFGIMKPEYKVSQISEVHSALLTCYIHCDTLTCTPKSHNEREGERER